VRTKYDVYVFIRLSTYDDISGCIYFVIVQSNCYRNIIYDHYNYRKLAGKTIFITGASRGIGKAIALKAAKDGANIVIAAKTAQPHPKLSGTIYTAAKEGNRVQTSPKTIYNAVKCKDHLTNLLLLLPMMVTFEIIMNKIDC
jgi:hypothetical protein